LLIAQRQPGVSAAPSGEGALALEAEEESLDAYTLALARAGVAVRRLELLISPLESMFFALTGAEQQPIRPSEDDLAPQVLAER
jgi:hypothetical protein